MSFRSLCFMAAIFVALVFGFLHSSAALAAEPVDPRLATVVPVSSSGYGISVSPTFSYLQPLPSDSDSVQGEIDSAMSPILERLFSIEAPIEVPELPEE